MQLSNYKYICHGGDYSLLFCWKCPTSYYIGTVYFIEEINGHHDVKIFSKHILAMETWWRVKPLALVSGVMSFISHYAIMFFFSLKQFSPFLQVVYLGKLQCVFNFCDSGPTSAFIAINTLYLSLLKLEIKQEGL